MTVDNQLNICCISSPFPAQHFSKSGNGLLGGFHEPYCAVICKAAGRGRILVLFIWVPQHPACMFRPWYVPKSHSIAKNVNVMVLA